MSGFADQQIIDLSRRRRIIGYSWRDFQKRLHRLEHLVIEVESDDGTRFIILDSERIFEKIVYSTDGEDIMGFYAVADSMSREMSSYPIDDYDRGSTVRRPVEELVLSCIIRGIPAVAWGY